ncbi:hypothetical protein [Erythrobacter sp.]|uniref:hypothetical protein n=1 Tax=Erythrobacter sp. TaxID=1042 RepID=UPI0025E0FB3C|nr:hypothetical protein [Erythrobacter sp.]
MLKSWGNLAVAVVLTSGWASVAFAQSSVGSNDSFYTQAIATGFFNASSNTPPIISEDTGQTVNVRAQANVVNATSVGTAAANSYADLRTGKLGGFVSSESNNPFSASAASTSSCMGMPDVAEWLRESLLEAEMWTAQRLLRAITAGRIKPTLYLADHKK